MRNTSRISAATLAILVGSAAWAGQVGKPAPELRIRDKQGGKDRFSLAQMRGRIVLFCFWRPDNTESYDAIVGLNELAKKYRPRGVKFVAVTPRGKEESKQVYEDKINYHMLFMSTSEELYNVTSYPMAYIIDTRGILRWRGYPDDDLETRLREQIERTPPVATDTASLRKRLARADSARSAGKLGRAYQLASQVLGVAEDISDKLEKEAEKLIKDIERDARKKLADVTKALKSGDIEKNCAIIADMNERLGDSEIVDDLAKEVSRLRGDKKYKDKIKAAITNAKGLLRNEQAAEIEKEKRYVAALEVYREVTEKFPDTEAAEKAQAAIKRINTTTSIQRQIKSAAAEVEAQRWLDLGDRYVRVELPDEAKKQYQKVVKQHSRSKAARKARRRLTELSKKP